MGDRVLRRELQDNIEKQEASKLLCADSYGINLATSESASTATATTTVDSAKASGKASDSKETGATDKALENPLRTTESATLSSQLNRPPEISQAVPTAARLDQSILSAVPQTPVERVSERASLQTSLQTLNQDFSLLQAAQQVTIADQQANPFQARVKLPEAATALTVPVSRTGDAAATSPRLNFSPTNGNDVIALRPDVAQVLAGNERAVRGVGAAPERHSLRDGTAIESVDGHITKVQKGRNSVSLEYDNNNQVIRISETINGRTSVSEAGKDFKLGNVSVNESGDVKVISNDGKHSYTLTHEFTRLDKAIGPKGDGSDDRLLQMRLASGVTREFVYDKDNTKVVTIRDYLPTNNGKPLIEETTRIGNSNIWEFKANYGKTGQRTNVEIGPDGSVRFAEVKRPSLPSDLVDLDNSDAMHTDLVSARQHLKKVAAAHRCFGGSEETVGAWAYKFEQRCRDLAHAGRKAPTDAQIIKCYKQLEKILEGKGNNINSAERRALVESAMRSYANPRKYINQGSHPSCGFNMVERHVVQTRPEEHARILQEAVNRGKVSSADGKWAMRLNANQIKPDREAVSVAQGGGWGWSYSNKIFQIAAIKLGHPGYQGNGHGFPGATEDQCRTANKFFTGEQKLPILNRWWGGKPSFNSLQEALKKGTVGYMVPGHMMSIDEAKVVNGVAYVHVDNSWNGSGDGWRRWGNV